MKYSSFHALLLCYKIYFELKYIARDTRKKKNEKKMVKIWGLISRMKFSRQKINLLYVALNYSKLFSNPLILSIHMYMPIMQKRKKRINSKSDFFLPNFFLQNPHVYELFSRLTVRIKRNVSFLQMFNNLSILFLRSSKSLIFPRMRFVGYLRTF